MAKKQQKSIQNIVTLSPQAVSALGLSQQPFTDNILSAEAIFTHAALTKLKDTIKHHLQTSDLLLIIEGEYGSGKTTFFRQLMQDEFPGVFLMPLQAEATDTLTQIQQKMSIHLKEQGEANYLDDNLKNLQVFDQTPVLMIDDAHVLSDTTLQEIIRYRQQLLSEKELAIKILLFANRGMATTIEKITDLQHNQLFVQGMPPLSGEQIQSFISHRLAIAGAQQPPLIDEKLIQAIYRKSAGRPLQVMQQATSVLEKLSKKSKHSISLGLSAGPVRLLAGLAVLATVAIAGYFLLMPQEQPLSTGTRQPTPPLPPPITAPSEQPEPAQPPASSPLEPAAITETTDSEPAATDTASMDADQAPLEDDQQLTTDQPPELIDSAEPAPKQAVQADAVLDQPVIDQPAAEPQAPQPAEIPPEVAPPPSTAVAAVAAVDSRTQAYSQPVNISASPAPAPTSKPLDPALQTLQQLGIKDSNWLQQQPPDTWTLQILGAREPATLANFVKQHQLGNNTAWYTTDLKGRPWYVLVHGFYSDREAARQSIQWLPASIQQARPWAKSLASVQQSIHR